MTDYDNNFHGALFRNDRKTTDNHPDYKGQCEVDQVEYWLSAWIRDSKDGKKYMSLAFTPKTDTGEQRPARTSQANPETPFDDDIPF